MARPRSTGLEYFSHDVNTERDLEFIEAKHGLIGYSVYFKLLERLYDDSGYYLEWSERQCIILAKKWSSDRIPVSSEYLQEIIDDLLAEGLFSQEVYDAHKVLTSAAAQRRYISGAERRTRIEIRQDYLLCQVELSGKAKAEVVMIDSAGFPVTVDGNPGEGDGNPDNGEQKPPKAKGKERESSSKSSSVEVCGDTFEPWLRQWVTGKRNLDNPAAFMRKVLENPAAYPDVLDRFKADQPPPRGPAPPPAPSRCDLCGSSDVRNPINGHAQCRDCDRMFVLTDGVWRPDPETGRAPPGQEAERLMEGVG